MGPGGKLEIDEDQMFGTCGPRVVGKRVDPELQLGCICYPHVVERENLGPRLGDFSHRAIVDAQDVRTRVASCMLDTISCCCSRTSVQLSLGLTATSTTTNCRTPETSDEPSLSSKPRYLLQCRAEACSLIENPVVSRTSTS
eukprot:4878690-Amphidinium_carterae.1